MIDADIHDLWPVEAIHPETGQSRRYNVAALDASEAPGIAGDAFSEETGLPRTEIDTYTLADDGTRLVDKPRP